MSALKAQVLGFESKAKSNKVPFEAQTNKHASVRKKFLTAFKKYGTNFRAVITLIEECYSLYYLLTL